ncbi:hypothetical protein [Streptomyces sp. NBC_00989]|uniref:hypothetical protein n=1 Tax=Streptomyces sp. NBC_00989 TaxID=2903705 RepID=UPI003865282C|nr:hypothetical protein OG714_36540 [Streptomyces sp. NBC_00989]
MPRAPKTPRAARPRWHYILTIHWTDAGGTDRMATDSGTCAPPPGYLREDMWELLYKRLVKDTEATQAYVVFFSLERNDLWPTGS